MGHQTRIKTKIKAKIKAKTIDEYPGAEPRQASRARKAANDHRGRSSKGGGVHRLPAFRLDGRMLVWFGASANHSAFYPGAVLAAHKDELEDFDTSKGTIRFQADSPPAIVVRKLAKARIAKNAAQERHAAAGAARRRGWRGRFVQAVTLATEVQRNA